MNIAIHDVTFSYHSSPSLIEVSAEFKESQVIGIIGPNGSGKTTLLKCINKILEPKQGSIFLDGKEVKRMSRLEVAKHVGYVPQSSNNNPIMMTVFEVAFMGRRPHINWQSNEKDAEKTWIALKMLNIEHLALRDFYQISGGEQQKVLIARAIAQEAKILLLDEPTSNLDIRHQLEVMNLTRELIVAEKLTAIVAIHDLNLASKYCDKIVMMKKGKIFACGETETVLTSENISLVYGVKVIINHYQNTPYIVPVEPLY